MYRLIFVFYFIFGVYGVENSGSSKILDYKFNKDVKGPYSYRFSTSHGFNREETAELLHEGTEFESIFLRGSYQYEGADGKIYTIKYRADDNGFHPEGEHIEVPPFVPWPSKVDFKYFEKNFETSTSTTSQFPKTSKSSTPITRSSNEPLGTKRTQKLSVSFEEAPSIPSRYLSTPKPYKSSVTILEPLSLSQIFSTTPSSRRGKTLVPQITKEYIPTSSTPPEIKRDIEVSSTIKNFILDERIAKPLINSRPIHFPKFTKEYIPTSPLPPKTNGDVLVSSTASNNKIENFTFKPSQRLTSPHFYRRDPTFIPGVTNSYIPSSSAEPAAAELKGEIDPTIFHEGTRLDKIPVEDNSSNLVLLTSQKSQFLLKEKDGTQIVENGRGIRKLTSKQGRKGYGYSETQRVSAEPLSQKKVLRKRLISRRAFKKNYSAHV